MGLNRYNVKKWCRMLWGNSLLHVHQGVGRCYSRSSVRGYYNDLTEKVSDKELLDEEGIPLFEYPEGVGYFSIQIFQYGLGANDLYLLYGDEGMREKSLRCARWAVRHQNADGSWSTFDVRYPEHPFSAMAQGEGVSLLLRAYEWCKDERMLEAAGRAYNFMKVSTDKGGTMAYDGGEVLCYEYTHLPLVLNGWVFALWGIYDYALYTKDAAAYDLFERSTGALLNRLGGYDNGYWSMYDLGGKIASPFYHDLHIAQLEVMYEMTHKEEFRCYAKKWGKYKRKWYNRYKSFVVKAFQKIIE